MKRQCGGKSRVSVLFLFAFLLFSQLVEGVSLGVSPGVSSVGPMLAGGYAEQRFVLSSMSVDPLNLHVEFSGVAGEWMSVVETSDRVLVPGKPAVVVIAFHPPNTIPAGNYEGLVAVFAQPDLGSREGFSSSLGVGVNAKVELQVTSESVTSCLASLGLQEIEEQDKVSFKLSVSNTGRTSILPEAEYTLWDETVSRVIETWKGGDDWVLPTTTKVDQVEGRIPLVRGTYFLLVEVKACNASFFEEVKVAESGTIPDKGDFVDLAVDESASAALGVVPLIVRFENVGTRNAEVKFVGRVYRDGRLVQVVETDPVMVSAEKGIDLESFVSANVPGEYRVIGRIYYNNRVSVEKETVFHVQEKVVEQAKPRSLADTWVFVGILLVIMVFLIAIRKKRRKK